MASRGRRNQVIFTAAMAVAALLVAVHIFRCGSALYPLVRYVN
jgi:hypothetical protein